MKSGTVYLRFGFGRNVVWTLVFAVLAALSTAVPAAAQQGTASINGTVNDQSGAAIDGAVITAKETGTGQVRSATADKGTYSLPLLPIGTYTVSCTHAGFATEIHPDVILTVGQLATVDFALKIGQVSESINVAASTEALNTVNAELGQTVNQQEIVDLPLNGRNPAELVFLTPGAVDGLKGTAFTRQDYTTFPSESGASMNGGRQGSTYYTLDGGNNMDNYTNLAMPFPNPDATQEFQVISNNFDAQYGYSAGGVVQIATRSGTNSWHGDGFEFLRNDVLNARDFFAHTRDSLKQNQFGASAGGRILRDKLFIFGNYQRTIQRQVVNGSSAHVPSNAMLNGDFSALLTGQTANACGAGGPANLNFDTGQVFQPNTAKFFTCPTGANAGQQVVVKTPFAGNQVPTSLFDPVALKFEGVLPRTDDPLGLVSLAGSSRSQNYQEFTVRPDWYISQNQHLSGHVFYDKFDHPLFTGGGDALLADRSWNAPYKNFGGNWLWNIRPNLVSNFVVAYADFNSLSVPGLKTSSGGPVCFSCFGVKVADPTTTAPGIDSLSVGGYFGIGQNTNYFHRHNYSFSETVTWNHGKHMVVAGVDVLTQYWEQGTDWLALPLIGFNGQFTGNAFSDFLLGQANSFEQGAGSFDIVTGKSWAPFVQDTIKLKPNLTLNVGLRWEPYVAFTPSKGRIPVFEAGKQSTRYPNAPLGLVYPGDPGVPAAGAPNDLPVFSPRISIAYQPLGLPNTVIRSGFAMMAVPFEMSYFNHAADSAPFSPAYTFGPTTTFGPVVPGGTPIPFDDPWSVFAPTGGKSPFPPFASPGYAPPSSTQFIPPVFIQTAFAPDFRIGRVLTWNFSIEHQFEDNILVKAAYVGSEGYHLSAAVDLNPGYYSTNPALNGSRAYGNFGAILAYEPWATASYNALQLTFEKRFSHGLQFNANYAWSKNIDSASHAALAFTGSVPNPFNLNFDHGISDLNYPQVFNLYGVYQTPALAGVNRLVRGVFGSWEISGTWHLQSGDPLTIGSGQDNSQSHEGSDFADYNGQPLNVDQGSKNQWLNQYFNGSAFTVNAPGTFGNSGRNILQGPGVNNLNAAFMKNFPFHERYKIQFRLEAYNLPNRAMFGNPDTNVSDGPGVFGRIFSTKGYGSEQQFFGYGAREMQVALKLYW